MNISVIIPTRNAEPWLDEQLKALCAQSAEAELLIADSGSTDATLAIAARYAPRVRVLAVPPERFDHGGTRDWALRQSKGEFVLFLTQDAVPADTRYIEKLLAPFADARVAAVCARQIARPDAAEYERLIRQFNYPDTPRVWGEADIPRYGVKAYFFSNSCSAFRRADYEAVGGFDAPIRCNEDMMIAAKLLHAGRLLAYEPSAAVLHSHRGTLAYEWRRNYSIGRVMTEYRARLVGAETGGEGVRLVRFVSGRLLRQGKLGELADFLRRAAVRFAAFRKGRRDELRAERD